MKVKSIACPLETFIPARAVGQRDVLSLTLLPMPLLQVAFVGVGARGRMAVTRWCHIPGVRIAAVLMFQERWLRRWRSMLSS